MKPIVEYNQGLVAATTTLIAAASIMLLCGKAKEINVPIKIATPIGAAILAYAGAMGLRNHFDSEGMNCDADDELLPVTRDGLIVGTAVSMLVYAGVLVTSAAKTNDHSAYNQKEASWVDTTGAQSVSQTNASWVNRSEATFTTNGFGKTA